METDATLDWTNLSTLLVVGSALRAVALVLIGFPLLFLVSSIVARITRRRFSEQSAMLIRKAVRYGGLAILTVMLLQELGFPLTTLLGVAGVAGLAIGFASQTSVSNIISGLFLISEKPFAVGDFIKVGDTMGIVLSIDLLSVKVRAFDNRFIRIPNENMIKTEVVNITRFPIRRVDINVGVAYKEDVGRVMDVLKDIAANNPVCLDEPEPLILFSDFGDSALQFLFGVWCVKSDFLKLKNSLMKEIKERFDAEGIEIPFPHRTLYAGSETGPMPVSVNAGQAAPAAPEGGEQ